MAIIKPLEYDRTSTELLYRIGERAREEALRQERLDEQNQARQFSVLSQIDPEVLYAKYDKDVVDRYLGGMQQGIASFLKANPRASYMTLQSEINKGISKIAGWNSKVKAIRGRIEQDVKSADKIYDKGRLLALSLDAALYKNVNGQKVLKDESELTADIPWVSDVAKSNKKDVIDPYVGEETANKYIKDPRMYTEVTRDASGKVVYKSTRPFWMDNNNQVKKGSSGFIDEDVFQQFYRNPEMSVWIDSQAEFYKDRIDPTKRPQDPEYYKRAFLTNWLELNKRGVYDVMDKSLISPSKQKNETTNYVQRVLDIAKSGTPQDLADALYEMKAGNGKYTVTNAKVAKNKGFSIEYETGEVNPIGGPVRRSLKLNPYDKNFAIDLAGFYQKATGSDAKLEKEMLSGKMQKSISPAKPKLSIKRSDIPAKAKAAGYTVSEYESLLKEKGVTII